MNSEKELESIICKNCSSQLTGQYCHNCGQKVIDSSNRTVKHLFTELLSNVFFLDNRFFVSVWYLIRFPGCMTVEYLEGKRNKFLSPITLFLFFNLIYFFVNPLSDYSLALYDQMYSQLYSEWTLPWVENKIESTGLDFGSYSQLYQTASDNISKSIMILNIPIIALFVYMMTFSKRKFYFDNLIFVFHIFSIFIFSWTQIGWIKLIGDALPITDDSIVIDILGLFFTMVLPVLYSILSIKKFMDVKWHWSIVLGTGVMISIILANLIYRLIILFVTLWVT